MINKINNLFLSASIFFKTFHLLKKVVVTNNITNLDYKLNQSVKIKSFNESKMRFCLIHLINYIKLTKPNLIICSQFHANIIMILACVFSGYKNKIILCERVPVVENLKYMGRYFSRSRIFLKPTILDP